MSELISVIIPVHNAEPYIDRLLKEAVEQSYHNLEVLLIDDGSTDESLKICRDWAKRDARIRIFEEEAAGVSHARNIGLRNSLGDYITFFDADDEVDPDFIDSLYQSFEEFEAQHHLKAGMTVCGYRTLMKRADTDSEKAEVKAKVQLPKKETYAGRGMVEALFTDEGFFSAVWNKMFRREILIDKDGKMILFDEDVKIAEDTLWLTRVLQRAGYGAAVERPLYTWIRRTESATGGKESVQIILNERDLSVVRAYHLMTKELESYDKALSHYTQKVYMGLLRDFLIEAYRLKDEKLVKRLMKQAIREERRFPRRNPEDGLFLAKYRLCLDLIQRKAPSAMLEKLNNL